MITELLLDYIRSSKQISQQIAYIIPPQTVAIEDEPSEAITSEVVRTLYGNSSSGGKRANKAFSASVPAMMKNTNVPNL